ncbi:hypothetical protein C0991_006373 [Blastosporella zonata]|nr:hypothetical protein C0991_006373 [Blastosporella zonata]
MSSTPTALSDQSSSQYRPQSFKNPSNLYLSSSKHDQQPISSVPPTDHDSFGWRLFHGAPRDPTVSEKPLTVRADRLQVSVLIAMPAQHKPMNHSSFSLEKDSDNEDLIPDVVFGITRLPYKPPNQIP